MIREAGRGREEAAASESLHALPGNEPGSQECLYGSSSRKAKYSVKIEFKRLGVVLAQNLTRFVSDGSSSTFLVWFEHLVQVEQDTLYTASAMLDGSKLSYFGQEGLAEVQCGKVTFQFQCSSDSTNGTGVQGGQIPEFIFYA